MIRVTQTFVCDHGPVNGRRQMPVDVKSMGHSVQLQERVCYCTGEAKPMKRSVHHHDPDPVLS